MVKGRSASCWQVSVWASGRQCVVVLHSDHHFDVHRQPGCLPNGRENADAYQLSQRPRQTDADSVRNTRRRIDEGVLQGSFLCFDLSHGRPRELF